MPVFFVAAAVSMGAVMERPKASRCSRKTSWLDAPVLGNVVVTTVVMYWTAFLYHFLLASEISMLGTSMPLVMEVAKKAASIRCSSG